MLKKIDKSQSLSKFIDRLSELAARKRGLPVVIGIGLFIIGFVLQIITFIFPSPLVEFIALLFNGVGVITAFIGLLLANPLGT